MVQEGLSIVCKVVQAYYSTLARTYACTQHSTTQHSTAQHPPKKPALLTNLLCGLAPLGNYMTDQHKGTLSHLSFVHHLQRQAVVEMPTEMCNERNERAVVRHPDVDNLVWTCTSGVWTPNW